MLQGIFIAACWDVSHIAEPTHLSPSSQVPAAFLYSADRHTRRHDACGGLGEEGVAAPGFPVRMDVFYFTVARTSLLLSTRVYIALTEDRVPMLS